MKIFGKMLRNADCFEFPDIVLEPGVCENICHVSVLAVSELDGSVAGK